MPRLRQLGRLPEVKSLSLENKPHGGGPLR